MKGTKEQGFTLVEMVLVITLVGIVAPLAATIFSPVIDSWAVGNQRAEATNEATEALARMTQEIAQLRNIQSVVTANASTLEFTEVNGTLIRYSLSNGNLLRNNDVLARGVQNLSFSYWDVNHNVIANPQVAPSDTDIWRIFVELVCQKGSQTVRMEAQVHPRNLPRS